MTSRHAFSQATYYLSSSRSFRIASTYFPNATIPSSDHPLCFLSPCCDGTPVNSRISLVNFLFFLALSFRTKRSSSAAASAPTLSSLVSVDACFRTPSLVCRQVSILQKASNHSSREAIRYPAPNSSAWTYIIIYPVGNYGTFSRRRQHKTEVYVHNSIVILCTVQTTAHRI
jgi:hypothetical protein